MSTSYCPNPQLALARLKDQTVMTAKSWSTNPNHLGLFQNTSPTDLWLANYQERVTPHRTQSSDVRQTRARTGSGVNTPRAAHSSHL